MRNQSMFQVAGFQVAGLAVVLGAAVLLNQGCQQDQYTGHRIRSNMSPEMESVALTHEQHMNRNARAIDTTARQVWDDLDKVMLVDRPLRMNRYPIP